MGLIMSQQKRSVQTRLKPTAIMEANPASQEARQKTNTEDLFAEIIKIGATLNGVATDVAIIK